jgi:hypothetical protein
MNEFFYHNGANILGNLEIVDIHGKKGLTCKRRGDTQQLLVNALNNQQNAQLAKQREKNKGDSIARLEHKLRELQNLLDEEKRGLAF